MSAGTRLEPGAAVPVRVTRGAEYTGSPDLPDSVLVELFDLDGELLAESRFESVDSAATLPLVELPDLDAGAYRLRATYFDGDTVVATNSVTVFIVAGEFAIRGLTTYPASSRPGADSLLSATLRIPDGVDPYLEWLVDGTVVRSGPHSETGSTIAISAPVAQGIYTVRVNLYPLWDPRIDFATVEPVATFRSELVVSSAPVRSASDLGPPERFFALYHLQGTFEESGSRAGMFPSISFAGRPDPALSLAALDDVFGYRFDGSAALVLPGVAWPVIDGALAPASFTLRVHAEPAADDAVADDTAADDAGSGAGAEYQTMVSMHVAESPIARLLLDDSGRIGLVLHGWSLPLWSAHPVLIPGQSQRITVALVPDGDRVIVQFRASDRLVSSDIGALPDLSAIPGVRVRRDDSGWGLIEGETRLGATTGGFVGIIDDFGVRFRSDRGDPAADASMFVDSMAAYHEGRLIFADGFDTADRRVEVDTDGGVEWTGSSMLLNAGGSLRLPQPAGVGTRVLRIEYDGDGEFGVAIADGRQITVDRAASPRAVLRLRFAPLGAVNEPDGGSGAQERTGSHDEPEIRVLRDGSLQVTVRVAATADGATDSASTVTITRRQTADGPIEIRSVLAFRDE